MRWETHAFSGSTADEAVAALHTWLGADHLNVVKQPIMVQDGHLFMYISHCPTADGHVIYVTALMGAPESLNHDGCHQHSALGGVDDGSSAT